MKLLGRAGLLLMVFSTFFVVQGAAETRWGLIGGAAINWMSGGDWADDIDAGGYRNTPQGAASYGFFLDLGLGKTFSLRPEFQVRDIGGKASGDAMNVWMSTRVIHLPLLLSAQYPTPWGTMYGVFGPSVDLIVKEIETRVRIASTGTESRTEENAYNSAVLGADIGVGYKLPFAGDAFAAMIEARYHRTFAKVLRDDSTAYNTFTLSFLLSFPLP